MLNVIEVVVDEKKSRDGGAFGAAGVGSAVDRGGDLGRSVDSLESFKKEGKTGAALPNEGAMLKKLDPAGLPKEEPPKASGAEPKVAVEPNLGISFGGAASSFPSGGEREGLSMLPQRNTRARALASVIYNTARTAKHERACERTDGAKKTEDARRLAVVTMRARTSKRTHVEGERAGSQARGARAGRGEVFACASSLSSHSHPAPPPRGSLMASVLAWQRRRQVS